MSSAERTITWQVKQAASNGTNKEGGIMRQQKEYLDRLNQLADKITQAHATYEQTGDEEAALEAFTLYQESYLPLISEYMGYVRGRDEG